MRIKHRFTFRSDENNIINFLIKKKVDIDYDEIINVIEIFEDNKDFVEIKNFLKSYNSTPLSRCIYTTHELDTAEWLTVRSMWRSYFAEPRDNWGYMFTTYDGTNYCDICGNGLVQKENFVLKLRPNWRKKNFLMIYGIEDELFVTSKIETVFTENNAKGINFLEVLNRSGKEIEGTRQIFVEEILKPSLKSESIRKEVVCEKCNFKKIFPKIDFNSYDKSAFENLNVDMIKSYEKYGEECACSGTIFMSQRLRQVLIANGLAKGLLFEPIKLV